MAVLAVVAVVVGKTMNQKNNINRTAIIYGLISVVMTNVFFIVFLTCMELSDGECCSGFFGEQVSFWESFSLNIALILNPPFNIANSLSGLITFFVIKFLSKKNISKVLAIRLLAGGFLLWGVICFVLFSLTESVEYASIIIILGLPPLAGMLLTVPFWIFKKTAK